MDYLVSFDGVADVAIKLGIGRVDRLDRSGRGLCA